MPKKEIKQRERELGRPLTMTEHVEIIEDRLWIMRIRFYVIITLLVVSVVGGGMTALYVYGKAQDKAIETTCNQANARWSRLRENLIRTALNRRDGETDKQYHARSVSTLALLDGLFNINCEDPKQRIPPTPSISSFQENQQ